MIIAWTLFYTFAGMQSTLPWSDCGNAFNDATCYKKELADVCNWNGTYNGAPLGAFTYYNNTCTEVAKICSENNLEHLPDNLDSFNFTMCFNATETDPEKANLELKQVYKRTSPSEDYWTRVALGLEKDTTWENFGGLRWQLVLCLAAAWIIVCLCLIKGVQSSGKVVYFTALFPYLVLTILLIRGALLPGAADGIAFYLKPKWDTLKNVYIWSDAATQIFYSLGPSFGGLITLASYNKFTNNCHRDAILIAVANCSTSVFAGFVIFSIIGFMANEIGAPVSEVIKSGPGLAFIAYPEAVSRMPGAPFWSFIFFLMLITLGLDSQFTMTETLTTALMDQWPHLREHKSKVVILTGVIGFFFGLSLCAKGGVFMFTLIDTFSASWSLLLLALFEIILLMYIYGYKNVFANIEEMTMRLPKVSKIYWMINWMAVTPIILAFITVATWYFFTPCYYETDVKYVFPGWVQAMGWMMASTTIVIVIAMGCYEYHRRNVVLGKPTSLRAMFRPVDKFGPAQATPVHPTAAQTYVNQAYE